MLTSLDPNDAVLGDIETPALVIEAAALDANIERMQAAARAAGISLRPHAKTHKSPDIARRQRQVGAIGIGCATLREAEDMSAAGVSDLLITSPMVGRDKLGRVVALHRRSPIMLVVDHPSQVGAIATALSADDLPVPVLLDVDVGQARTGIVSPDDAVALARQIRSSPRLRFAGLQGYAGHIQHIIDGNERRQGTERAAALLRAVAEAARGENLPVDIISGSGTGTSAFDLAGNCYTELQTGSYVFMDADYGRLREPDGAELPYQHALFVLAAVVSANRAGQVTVDAGTKALAVNGPAPDRFIGVPAGSSYVFAGDEHGTIKLPPGAAAPAVGRRVLIGATHCDPTVNLHSSYRVVTADGSIARWPIVGRYG
jgi:D-serine deaminase-like pyridoxal phosphate-dependent protein